MDKFTSKDFNPAKLLANPDLKISEGKEYKDLYALSSDAHQRGLKAMPSKIEGVPGSGGFPPPKIRQKLRLPQGRQFHEDQGPLPERQGKRLRNVLLRMEEMQGPLAALRQCRDSSTRIKVYTRNHSNVRGILTGYVVAFDKYWNLVLRDVDEVFQKKIRYPAVSLGNVDRYMNVADLSIQPGEDSSGRWKEDSCAWPNPFAKVSLTPSKAANSVTGEDFQPSVVAKLPKDSLVNCEMFSSEAGTISKRALKEKRIHPSTVEDRKKDNREKKSIEGVRIDRRTTMGNSSHQKDVVTLQLSSHGKEAKDDEWKREWIEGSQWLGKEREGALASLETEKMRRELQQLGDEDPDEERVEAKYTLETAQGKRRRKRRKYEIRERHVKQLLIRGENIVIINVLQV